jgi:hypothetical protein
MTFPNYRKVCSCDFSNRRMSPRHRDVCWYPVVHDYVFVCYILSTAQCYPYHYSCMVNNHVITTGYTNWFSRKCKFWQLNTIPIMQMSTVVSTCYFIRERTWVYSMQCLSDLSMSSQHSFLEEGDKVKGHWYPLLSPNQVPLSRWADLMSSNLHRRRRYMF